MPAQNQLFFPDSSTALPTDPHLLLGDAQLAATLYGEIGNQIGEQGQATALGIEQQGQDAEAAQYGTSASIAEQNAKLALVGGDIQKYQAMRKVQQTMGTQQAYGAANGFASAGSALDVATASMRQGLLQTQLIGTNADLTAGGYLEQASSARAEQQTATTASQYSAAMAASASAQAANAGKTIDTTKAFMAGLPGGPAILNAVNTGDLSGLNPNSIMNANGTYNPVALQAQILNHMNTSISIGMPGATVPTYNPAPQVNAPAAPSSMFQGH